jgi:hypothetical protein
LQRRRPGVRAPEEGVYSRIMPVYLPPSADIDVPASQIKNADACIGHCFREGHPTCPYEAHYSHSHLVKLNLSELHCVQNKTQKKKNRTRDISKYKF